MSETNQTEGTIEPQEAEVVVETVPDVEPGQATADNFGDVLGI